MASVSRLSKATVAGVVCAAIAATAAVAAYNYTYQNGYAIPYAIASDFTVQYRNYNDSCSGDGYAWTKSIYTLGDGSWIAAVEAWNACGFSKAHLGPSLNYGYANVQSKCKNMMGVYIYLACDTTRS